MTDRMLLAGLVVVPVDGPAESPIGTVRAAAVRIEGERIAAVGELEPEPGETVVDCRGLTAVPGFVQGHVHFCQTLFRGLAGDLPLLDWLRERVWPLEAAHDAGSTRVSAELAAHELLRGGTTTVQAHESTRHTEEVFEVAERAGLTAVVGNCLMDVRDPGVPAALPTTTGEALAIADELRRVFDGRGRLHYAVTPRFVLSCSEELARGAADLAARHGLRVHTHAAEHRDEVAAVRARFGSRYLEVLDRQGLLGARTGLAHCVHLDEDERALLAERGAAVLHCPTANLKLGSGIAPVVDYRRRGVRVAIGADGAPCNDRLSALTELRQAALLQAMVAGPGTFTAAHALHAATAGGADALGIPDVGRIAAGARADLAVFDLDAAHLGPGGDPVSRLVWSATEADLRHVVVGGRFAIRDGAPCAVDEADLRRRARAALAGLLGRAGLAR